MVWARPSCKFGPDGTLEAEKGLGEVRIPAGRNPPTAFPPAQRCRINVQEPGERRLRDAPFPPEGEQALAKGRSSGPGRVAEKPNDGRQEPERRVRPVEFPVGDRGLVHTYSLGDLALQQAEIESPLPEMISNSYKDLRVAR